jgi:hypothetical protein
VTQHFHDGRPVTRDANSGKGSTITTLLKVMVRSNPRWNVIELNIKLNPIMGKPQKTTLFKPPHTLTKKATVQETFINKIIQTSELMGYLVAKGTQ